MAQHRRSICSLPRVVVALLLVSLAATPAGAQTTPTSRPDPVAFTTFGETGVTIPRWFAGTDGQIHLAYELLLTNALPVAVTVTSAEVLDAGSREPVVRLEGAELLAVMSLAWLPDVPAVQLPPSSVGAVWFDLPLDSEADIPASVEHQVTIELPPDVPAPTSFLTQRGWAVDVDQRSPVVLGPPLAGSGWTALGSCCDGPHRRALFVIDGESHLSQRFAIDFNRLDAQNRPGAGDPALYTSYPTYGQPVLAVAHGTVVEAVDRYPDLMVGEAREELTAETAGGNRVVLDLGNGRFAIYAHLQAGSVMVQAGDRVTSGQHIANVGSSGTGGGPHLHFQVTDAPSILVGDGLPYVFDTFDLTGALPPLDEVLPYYDTLEPIPVTTEDTGPRRNELPLGSDLVTFPSQLPDN